MLLFYDNSMKYNNFHRDRQDFLASTFKCDYQIFQTVQQKQTKMADMDN